MSRRPPPTFTDFTPENGHADKSQRQEVGADVTDSGSGISSAENIWVVFAHDSITDKGASLDGSKVNEIAGDTGTSSEIDNGFRITNDGNDRKPETLVFWWVVAKDTAGNIGVSDRVLQNEDGYDNTCDAEKFNANKAVLKDHNIEIKVVENTIRVREVKGGPDTIESIKVKIGGVDQPDITEDLEENAKKIKEESSDSEAGKVEEGFVNTIYYKTTDGIYGCQPYSIRVDTERPTMDRARTGEFWNLTKDGKDRTDQNKFESIRVVFDEELDGSTVQADDFEVDGSVPSAADFYTDKADSVFLTVPTLDANDRPSIELVGEVTDRAGNKSKTTKLPNANVDDAIAPTLTVTLEGSFGGGDRVLTNKDITVTIEADEPISAPTVVISQMKNAGYTTELENYDPIDLDKTGDYKRTASQVKGQKNKYSTKFAVTEEGLYSVYVSATDTSGKDENKGWKGADETPVDTSKATKDLLFEVDTGIAEFKVEPKETDDPKAFITLDYSDEANEYYKGIGKKDDPGYKEPKDYDSFSKLTIVEATLIDPDGEKTDITDALNASANSAGTKFRYNDPDGLAMGEYKLEVKAKDEAGNEDKSAQTETFKIEERAPFKVELAPGSNFVSFPSNPQDPDINKVIPADHPVTRVLTYDPKVPGGWLTAVRGEDGMFEGTLKELTSNRAYIITTDSFEALEVSIPKPSASAAAFLPTIALTKGWNLVPIIDIDGDFKKLGSQMCESDSGTIIVGTVIVSGGCKKDEKDPNYNYFGKAEGDISTIFTFDTQTNGWSSIDGKDVEIGKGYWVYATKSVTVIPN